MRTVAFLVMATLVVGRAAVAQDAPAPGVQQSRSLPRLDPKRDDKAFAAALAETKRFHDAGEFLKAYTHYLGLAKERPDDPDVLWGLGECGTAIAPALMDPEQQRARLADAKAAYERYAEVERRSEFAEGPKSRIARAKARAAQLEDAIAAIVIPEMRASVAVTTEVAVLPPKPTPAPSDAGVVRASVASAPVERRRVVSHEEHLKCLTQRGLVTAQFANVDGKIVMQLRPPENWRDIPCGAR